MDYDAIFAAYYIQYRTEAVTPAATDDEYIIGLGLANEAVRRWANYDGTYWKELFTTAQATPAGGSLTVVAGTSIYAAPTAFREAGGFIKIKDSNGNTVRTYAILEPQEAQFRGDNSQYAYFTGTGTGGTYNLHLNPAPDSAINGMNIDYVYYKFPTLFTTGVDVTEMQEPYFCVHRMLANRFRGSRNPYYASAKADAEDALKTMQAINNSGNWADPWKLADNSGTTWGDSLGGSTGGSPW